MAIEAREFTEKDELIVKLKKVSEGLSVIAQEKQKISDAKKELEAIRLKTQNEQLEFSQKKEALENRMSVANSELTFYAKKTVDLKNERKDIEDSNPKEYADFDWKIWFSRYALIAMPCVGGLTYTTVRFADYLRSAVKGVVAIVCMVVAVVAVLISTRITVNERKKRGIINQQSLLDEMDVEIKDTEELVCKCKCNVKNMDNEYEELLASSPSDFELKLIETKVNTVIIPICSKKIQETKDNLHNDVPMLSEEDWCSADTLIYYLKTGRADSIKEALLVIDVQTRNEKLVSSIGNAAYNITYSVNRMADSMKDFSEEINNAYRKTASKLDQSYSDMRYAMENISSRVNAQLSDLSSTIERQGRAITEAEKKNADLLAHSNRNSDELMYNIRYNS